MDRQTFNVIINTGDEHAGMNGYITWHKVSNLDKCRAAITRKYPGWRFATVFDHRSREKLKVIKP
jgi:hypothetical protein